MNVSAAAVIKKFYKYQEIEDSYQELTETPTAPLLKKIIEMGQLVLADEERVTIAEFVSHLITRNPRHRHIEMELFKFVKNRKADYLSSLGKEEAVKDMVEAASDFGGAFAELVTYERAERVLNGIIADPECHIQDLDEASDDLAIVFPFGTASKLSKTMLDSEWRLIESGSSRVFVSSDNPVSSIPPIDTPMEWKGGFLNQCICLPLSPRKCLVISNGDGFGPTVRVSREAVERVNWYTMFFAHNFVFSSLKSKTFEEAFNKTIKGESDRIMLKHLSPDLF